MGALVTGASGSLGIPLTRLLVARRHSVVDLIHNPAGADGVRAGQDLHDRALFDSAFSAKAR